MQDTLRARGRPGVPAAGGVGSGPYATLPGSDSVTQVIHTPVGNGVRLM